MFKCVEGSKQLWTVSHPPLQNVFIQGKQGKKRINNMHQQQNCSHKEQKGNSCVSVQTGKVFIGVTQGKKDQRAPF